MAREPGSYICMLMGPVVIHDEVPRDIAGELPIDHAQEFQELLIPVARIALADHLPLQYLQGSEKCSGAVPLVVVGYSSTTALFDRQTGLGPVQRLNLGLLVSAQHDRFFRRIQIQPDDIGHFLQEPGGTGEFECLHAMGFEVVS